MRLCSTWLWLALIALGTVDAGAQRRDPLEYIRILESAERVRKLQVDRVVETLEVKPGQRVADLGAGSGLFARPLARRVAPDGVVYAVDIDPDLLNHVKETAREQNISNIRTVLAGEYDPRIPEKVDLVLISDTLHHIKDQQTYLRDLTRYLAVDARVAVRNTEHRTQDTEWGVLSWNKLTGGRRTRRWEHV
jgi:ubiquinone/menaquinone biosynthesis C-methylase UbiE